LISIRIDCSCSLLAVFSRINNQISWRFLWNTVCFETQLESELQWCPGLVSQEKSKFVSLNCKKQMLS
jgi:hypothetical protein